MSKQIQKSSKRQTSFFDPDKISSEIYRAVCRDFKRAQHEYCTGDSLTLHAFNSQVNDLLKKYNPTTTDKAVLEEETYAKFISINEHMKKTNAYLHRYLNGPLSGLISAPPQCGGVRVQSSDPFTHKVHKRARAYLLYVLGSQVCLDEWFTECRNSGGSSLGVPYQDTSQTRKFTFPMTVTKRAEPLFRSCMAYNFQLQAAVKEFNRENPVGSMFDYVEGSRATTVDKTATSRRFICIEPTCNMYLQQGLMQMMYKRMQAVGLNVESLPTEHKKRAKYASIHCHEATIDWSSASDCVSIELLRWVLPPEWFDAIIKVRCDNTFIKGERYELEMISSMGNAATFPLETLVFWAYAHAVRVTLDNTGNTCLLDEDELKVVSVFGDDCIVPTYMAADFIAVMQEVGFIVNKEKSFYGPLQFRESCGGDYLVGRDVRPYHLRAPQSTKKSALEPWLYIIFNRLYKKYIMYFGELGYVYDRELFRCLFRLMNENKILVKLVPSFYPDDAGLKISSDISRFAKCYHFQLDRIARSTHGTYSFPFCKFQYWDKREVDDGIALSLWLQKPVASKRKAVFDDLTHETSTRKRGGYVVAKGLTSHWFVPNVNSGR